MTRLRISSVNGGIVIVVEDSKVGRVLVFVAVERASAMRAKAVGHDERTLSRVGRVDEGGVEAVRVLDHGLSSIHGKGGMRVSPVHWAVRSIEHWHGHRSLPLSLSCLCWQFDPARSPRG